MRLQQQIQVNELLLQREAVFVRIHEIERQVDALLGEPYPFDRPRLPSDQKSRKRMSPGRPAAGQRQPQNFRQEEGESGYLVTYSDGGQNRNEHHVSLSALETLLASQTADLFVRRIEALDSRGTPVRCLFTRDA